MTTAEPISVGAPAPYAADTRAKGWKFVLDTERIRQSDTWALTPHGTRPWLLMLWMTAWEQTPCGSLPSQEPLIAAKMDCDPKAFAKMREHLMRGWWLAADGRLYHPVITEQVLAMLKAKTSERDRKAEYRRKMDEERTRKSGGVPGLSRGTDAGQTRDSTGCDATGTGTGTSNTGGATAERAGAGDQEPDTSGFTPTARGLVGQALKRAGIPLASLNLADPRFTALIEQGATPEEFEGIAREAVAKGISKPLGWICTTLEGRRAEAARIDLAPKTAGRPGGLTAAEQRVLDAVPGIASTHLRGRPAALVIDDVTEVSHAPRILG